MRKNKLKYEEGQWFAVPLLKGGYALGIVARGNYKAKIALGYFFGPIFRNLPSDDDTLERKSEDAILITRFGDLGIVNGRWPRISSSRSFSRSEWPIPLFGLEISLVPGKGFLRKYIEDITGNLLLKDEVVVPLLDIQDKPMDVVMGGGLVESRLTNILTEE